MGGPQRSDDRAAQTAEGTLARTPLAHLLVYAYAKRLTCELSLEHGTRNWVVRFGHGFVRDVSTNAVTVYLGQILYEQGAIDTTTLNASLAELAASRKGQAPKLHGELLVARGAISDAALDAALRHQIERKLVPAFELPGDTRFVFRPDEATSSRVEVDPLLIAWRGVRAHGDIAFAQSVLGRLGSEPLCIAPHADLSRFRFSPEERALVERYRKGSTVTGDPLDVLVAYVLAIAKMVVPRVEQSRPTRFTTPPGMNQVAPPRTSERVPVAEPARPITAPPSSRKPPTSFVPTPVVKFANDGKLNFQNAEVAFAQRKLDVAEALCQRAVDDEPRHAEYLAFLGWIKSQRTTSNAPEVLSAPLELLDRALDLFPGCERAYVYRAAIRKRLGDEAGALSDYRTLHTLNPAHVEAAREVRLHDMRARREPEERSSSGLFQKILKKK